MRRHQVCTLLTSALISCAAFAQGFSPEQAPFSASPQALQDAFSKLETGTNPAIVLLEDSQYGYDSAGLGTFRHRMILNVLTKAGAEGWSTVERTWAPWREERPTVRARVIAKDGTVHELDPKTIADAPVRDKDDDVLTDRRMVRAPLPAIEPGSIVEQEVVRHQTMVPFETGDVQYFYFGSSVPVQRTMVRVQIPENIPFHFKTRLLPDAVASEKVESGIRRLTLDQAAMKALDEPQPLLPSDEPRSPYIVFSTARDWNTVAKAYSEVVERQLAGFSASPQLPKFPPGATRDEKILAIINFLNKEIRYTGIEFSESALVPHKPSEVLAHKYGDCKDKSTLAVALLRAAGIEAYVALLDSSTGADIEPAIPGLDAFNHAIVYVSGEPGLWLDPTDRDLRLHVISPENQGRYALIARPQTTELIRTPELTAEENRVIETRQFQLSELGRAQVTETSQVFGTADRFYRGTFGDQEPKALRDSFKDYIEWTYGETKNQAITAGDAADLTKPFLLKIELTEAQRGTTARTEAAVAIRVNQLASRLPDFFRTDPKELDKGEEQKAPPPRRTADFAIPEPHTYEWRYVIKAPPGFRLRRVPEPIDRKIGIAVLTARFASDDPTTLTGDFKFLMTKRRFSAAEGLALRDAVVELEKQKMLLVYFDQVGETELASGKVKEALAEFAALRKLHPNEALHTMQTARAMLAAGAGETARAEARRAVSLEPGSEQAYVQLAEVLKSDLVGRPMEKGYDRDGAVAAYRNALEIDPKDDETRANLAILLEHDRAGVRYASGANLNDAIAAYAPIRDKLAGLGLQNNYPVALLRAGRAQELKEYLAKQSSDDQAIATLRVCADALLNGAPAGIQKAGEVSGVDARRAVLAGAAQTMTAVRRYAIAADLMAAAAEGSGNPAAVTTLIEILRKTRPAEELQQTTRSPEETVRTLLIRILLADKYPNSWRDIISPLMLKGHESEVYGALRGSMGAGKGKLQSNGMSVETALDLGLSAIQSSSQGDDNTGWVIRLLAPGNGTSTSQQQVFFVVRQDETYRIVAATPDFSGVARLVLQLADQGKIDLARTWLDRVRQELPAGSGDDPLSGPMFSRVWQRGQQGDAEAIRTAAGLLLTDQENGIGGVIHLLEAASKPAGGNGSDAIAASLAEAYFTNKQYQQSLGIAEELLRKLPRSASALRLTLKAAYAAGGVQSGARIADAYLDQFKSDIAGLRAAAAVAMSYGDAEKATAVEKQIIDSGRGEATDYNNLAWAALLAAKVTPETLDLASRGMMLSNNNSTAIMHTLAAVEAELDKPAEARASLLQRMTGMGEDEPDDNDWYVFGRIAECYGLQQEAAGMYHRVQPPRNTLTVADSSYALAQRRLKSMAAGH